MSIGSRAPPGRFLRRGAAFCFTPLRSAGFVLVSPGSGSSAASIAGMLRLSDLQPDVSAAAAEHRTAQHGAAKHGTAKHGTAQYSTAQHQKRKIGMEDLTSPASKHMI
jgi:hypothetical protein